MPPTTAMSEEMSEENLKKQIIHNHNIIKLFYAILYMYIYEKYEKYLNEYLDEQKNKVKTPIPILESDINDIIKSLNNGKSVGNSMVQNEMFKYANCDSMIQIVKEIMNRTINEQLFPITKHRL